MLITIAGPLREFHGRQAKEVRSPAAGLQWNAALADGEGLSTLCATAALLQNPEALHFMGMCTAGGQPMPGHADSIMGQWFLAQQAGNFLVSLLVSRLKTELQYIYNLLGKLALLSKGTVEADRRCMLYFRDCWEAAVAAGSSPSSTSAWWKKCLGRSVFSQSVLRSLVALAAAGDWSITPALRARAELVCGGFTQTKLVEDAFQRERHHESHQHCQQEDGQP